MSVLQKEVRDGTLFLTMNRPEKRNALNDELVAALTDAILEDAADEEISAVVLRGAGNDFCSGADLEQIRKMSDYSVAENLEDAETLMDLFLSIRSAEVPVIAAVQGNALAGGCGLATACDIVVAAESAVFGYPEVNIGFVPAMVAAIVRRNLGEKLAFEILTQGFTFPAAEAYEMGLVNLTVADDDLEQEAAGIAAKYRRVSRSAVALTKRLLYQIDGLTFESALGMGAQINSIARMTDDCRDGIERFLRKKES